jgi:hypothetical protein
LSTRRILLDSNAYFRLAEIIKGLLSMPFGHPPAIQLRILGGTTYEYYYEPRLRSKFSWADKDEHKDERRIGKLVLKAEEKVQIAKTRTFMLDAARDMNLNCSRFDVECLATARTLEIPLASDDLALCELAEEYDQTTMSTLELLKLMLDEGRISMADIQATVVMWDYLDDHPSDFLNEFRRLFSTDPERLL